MTRRLPHVGEEENTMVRNHKVGLRPRLDKVNVRAGK